MSRQLQNIDQNEIVNVKDYGATGDGVTDDTVAIQRAILKAQNENRPLFFPPGTFNITSELSISAISLSIIGSGMDESVISVASSGILTSVFNFLDLAPNSFFRFVDFQISGNNKVSYGIYSITISHTKIQGVKIQGTRVSAISLGYGWDNDILECELANNYGNGINLTVNSNNVINILRNKIYNNSGFGIHSLGGATQVYEGNTFEQNAFGAIYLQLSVLGVNIVGNYFEANANVGYTFTSPTTKTIKSDIIINGSGTATTMGVANKCGGIKIGSNYFNSSSATSSSIWLIGCDGLNILNNVSGSGLSPYLLGFSLYNLTTFRCDNLQLFGNNNFTSTLNPTDVGTNNYMTFPMYEWEFDGIVKKNYISCDVFRNSKVIDNGNPVVLSRSSSVYNGSEAWEFSAVAGGTDYWGQVLNISNYPELQNALVCFSCWAKVDNSSTGVGLYCTNPAMNNTQSSFGNTNWQKITLVSKLGSSGSVGFCWYKLGAPAAKTYISRPVLTVIGSPYNSFYNEKDTVNPICWKTSSVPANGTWAIGDVVYNTVPVTDGPLGWVCTSAGSPGTWAEFGTIGDTHTTQQQIVVPFAHDTGGGVANSTTQIPAGAYVNNTTVVITEAFNGTTPTVGVTVYNVGGSTTLQATTENNPPVIGNYAYQNIVPVTNAGPVRVTVTPSGSTTGEGYALVSYSVPRT